MVPVSKPLDSALACTRFQVQPQSLGEGYISKEYVLGSKKVYFTDKETEAYMSTDSRPCTPSPCSSSLV